MSEKAYAVAVVLLVVVALGFVGREDYRAASVLHPADRSEVVRHSRNGLYASYSSSGVSRPVRLAEVWR